MVDHIINGVKTLAATNVNNAVIGRLGSLLSKSSSAAVAKIIPNNNS